MNLLRATATALRNPGMPRAYSKWIATKLLNKQGPFLQVGFGARIGQTWNSFSEYWTFRGAGSDPASAIPQPIADLIATHLKKANGTSIAVDIGANIGAFAVAIAAAGYTEVLAFEHILATFDRLAENIALNNLRSRIKLNRLGIGDNECSALMYYDPNSPATAAVVNEPSKDVQNVSITTLDRYAAEQKIQQIDFLKIDTEGYESAVLRGAVSLLRKRAIKAILLEWCPELLNRTGSSPEELWRTVIDSDYRLYRIPPTGEISSPATLAELKLISWENAIALLYQDTN
jgi:FkbM family methyltransferase